jgi:hypothetical protein
MQIILLALVAGCVLFLVVAVFLRKGGKMPPPPDLPIITYVAVAFGLAYLVGAHFVPGLVTAWMRRKMARETGPGDTNDANPDPFTRDTDKLAGLLQTYLILTAAPLEGGIFFLLIAYLIEGSLLGIIGAIVLLLFLGSKFPTRPSVELWIEEQRDLLLQERTGV